MSKKTFTQDGKMVWMYKIIQKTTEILPELGQGWQMAVENNERYILKKQVAQVAQVAHQIVTTVNCMNLL